MKRADQDRLLDGILGDESLAQLRHISLAGMLEAARARRRRRVVVSTVGALAVLFSLLVVATRRSEKIPSVEPVSAPAAARVKFIDDAQLLALFPDRSVALIGPPGNQKLLFLDEVNGAAPEIARR
jgi:hypothetical protein